MSEGPLGALDQLTKILYEWGTRTPLGALAQSAGENVAGSLGRMKEAAQAPAEESLGPRGAIPKLVAMLQQVQSRGGGAPVAGLPIDRPPTREEAVANAASEEGSKNVLNKALYSMGLTGGAPAEPVGGLGGMFMGKAGKFAPLGRIEKAEQMLAEGATKEQIYKETSPGGQQRIPGISFGKEGKPRWEISDRDMAMPKLKIGKSGRLILTDEAIEDVVRHPEYWDNYPQLKGRALHLNIDPSYEGGTGKNLSLMGDMEVNARDPKEALWVLSHEMQHPVQVIENWTRGGNTNTAKKLVDHFLLEPAKDRRVRLYMEHALRNPGDPSKILSTPLYQELLKKEDWAEGMTKNRRELFRLYRRLAAEGEARNTQYRLEMGNPERGVTHPELTEALDIPRELQVLAFPEMFRKPYRP